MAHEADGRPHSPSSEGHGGSLTATTGPILQVIASAERRGAEIFAVDLADSLRGRGRRVETVALVEGSRRPFLDVPVLGRRPLAPSTLLALRRRTPRAGAVVAHGSTSMPAVALSGLGTRASFVYRSIGDPAYWRSTPARRLRTATFLRAADAVVVLWEGAARSWVGGGVDRDRIHVIPNGVRADRFPLVTAGARAAARQRLTTVPEGAGVVLYAGALSPEKDVDLAIRAVAALDAHLVVLGEGNRRADLEALGRTLAPGRVHFVGTSARPQETLAAADVVVLASRTEGMPAVLIEAGLSGIPVVATDVGAVREVVASEEAGLVVPPGDAGAVASALRRVLEEPGRAREAARAHCLARFDIDVVARAWEELFTTLDARRRR